MVFYNAKLPKQDVYYILVPRYILYLYGLAYTDSFEIYKDGFRNLETVFRKSRVYELVIYNFIILDLQSRIKLAIISNYKSSI